jgi:hypothetical protein
MQANKGADAVQAEQVPGYQAGNSRAAAFLLRNIVSI